VNTIIIGYSAIVGRTESPVSLLTLSWAFEPPNGFGEEKQGAQGSKIIPPTTKMKNSIAIETVLT
jgi:hypothetical protein